MDSMLACLSLTVSQSLLRFISDVIQPSHPLAPSSPSTLNLSQHQRLFQRVGCLHPVTDTGAAASVLPMSTQGSFPLRSTGLISLLPKESQIFSSTTARVEDQEFK